MPRTCISRYRSGSFYNRDYDIRYDCNVDGQLIKILRGGQGGLGNEKFKSATNRAPYTPGQRGESGTFDVELQLIADVGDNRQT